MVRKKLLLVLAALMLVLLLAGCRNETQNRLRRNLQEFSNARMFITVYSRDGTPLFDGVVDGKVTRASTESASGGPAAGTYVYWYDDRGRYHQTDLPYFVTSYDPDAPDD